MLLLPGRLVASCPRLAPGEELLACRASLAQAAVVLVVVSAQIGEDTRFVYPLLPHSP